MTSLIYLGRLEAQTPILPGDPGEGPADKAVRRDGSGRPLIPGTAIAGVLRGLAMRLAPALGCAPCKAREPDASTEPCGCAVCALFGEICPDEDMQDGGQASRLLFSHALAELPAGAGPSFRDGVGIERRTGAAAGAAAAKFDYEVLPVGTQFGLRIEWEPAAEGEDGPQARLLAACLTEWQAGRLWLGAGAARGLGALVLRDLDVRRRDLSQSARLTGFLRTDTPWDADPPEPDWPDIKLKAARASRTQPNEKRARLMLQGFADLRVRLRLPEPFLINDPALAAQSGFDHAPIVQIDGNGNQLVLPGASLRGVLRAQCERIARTLATHRADKLEDFGACGPACDTNSRPARGERPADHALTSCATLAEAWLAQEERQGRNPILKSEWLCPACQLFGSTRFGSRLRIEGGSCPLPPRNAARIRDFLAVDRFTSGAKASAKFDALVPAQDAEIDVRLFLEDPEPSELGWLYLGLRDLVDGLVRVGFGAAKGFGRAYLETGDLTIGHWPWNGHQLGVAQGGEQDAAGLFDLHRFDTQRAGDRAALLTAATGWVNAFHKRLETFRRREGFVQRSDSYFGTPVQDLYPSRARDAEVGQ